ncbi:DUF6212 domain-containing protein [Parvularcula sp. IMCC14364]|uniref:DUF6212 domain-containing protein n=1 Tax=Parvularcula sp. IMCC14364 TaxID=3067902 RepID=UPI002740F0DA|nr:DUF6212 domain-containing protein [Parvularcula sp. IMCC14364]
MSLFNADTKLFYFDDAVQNKVSGLNSDDLTFRAFRVSANDNGILTATEADGQVHTFNAAAAGAVVFLSAAGSNEPLAEQAATLWTSAGLTPPPVVNASSGRGAELTRSILSTVNAQLESELQATATEAISLDRQIAVLREEVENLKMQLVKKRLEERFTGTLPILAYENDASGSTVELSNTRSAKQMLPFAGSLIVGLAIQLAQTPDFSNGYLRASLVAREDGKTLCQWQIREKPAHDLIALSIEEPIAHKYRYIDLVLEWMGTDVSAVSLKLAESKGDPEGYLKLSDDTDLSKPLMLKVWTGNSFSHAEMSDWVFQPTAIEELGRALLARPISDSVLASAKVTIEREFNFRLFNIDDSGLMLHPTLHGPSVADFDPKWTRPVNGFSAEIVNPHEEAPKVSFNMVISEEELSGEDVIAVTEGQDIDGAVAAGWKNMIGGTRGAIELHLDKPQQISRCYLLTKVDGDSVSHAHVRFRKLSLLI